MTPWGLSRLSLPDLEGLLAALTRGRLPCPLSRASLQANGFGSLSDDLLAVAKDLDRLALEAVLRVAIAERVHRPPPRLDLAWTGPEAKGSTSRDTAVLVRRLFEDAEASVLVAGFAFDHGADIFAPLHAAMRRRALRAEIFLDIRRPARTAEEAEPHVRDYARHFLATNWPFGPPFPSLFYDPRTALPGTHASLHAKCIVVDARLSLVTSANFTDRGQTRNIELGVLVEDPNFGRQLAAQWRALVDSGLLLRVPS